MIVNRGWSAYVVGVEYYKMSEVIIYQNEKREVQVRVRLDGETVWLEVVS
ncbi:MAG: hypothetical protein HY286_19265 [Planctomycetes bacterium]|nr:hypothetical protein [Planctomycetota bacterium]